jgi:hypothetical protein
MSTRADRPRDYFAKLLDQPDEKIDYSEIPATTRADWEDAEVLLPVTADEFRAIREFVRSRRERDGDRGHPSP